MWIYAYAVTICKNSVVLQSQKNIPQENEPDTITNLIIQTSDNYEVASWYPLSSLITSQL